MKTSKIRALIKLVEESKVDELEISSLWGKVRIRKKIMDNSNNNSRNPQVVEAVPDRVIEVTAESKEPSVKEPVSTDRDNFLEIKSPMVGTFYRAPASDAHPFVEPGKKILRGQTVCIIEAMKLMNEIESEYEGRVVEVLVQNAHPVQFGQPLFLIEPA